MRIRTVVHDESIKLAKERVQLPGSKLGKLGFTRPPGFGEEGSQGGGNATEDGDRRPDLSIRTSTLRDSETIG
jgi:hypothetical protein